MNSTLAAMPAQVDNSGEVSREFGQSHMNLKMLEEVVTQLETRLQPIVAERKQGVGVETSAPEPVRVPFAQELYTFNVSLGGVTETASIPFESD
jgi:hypothetical protein